MTPAATKALLRSFRTKAVQLGLIKGREKLRREHVEKVLANAVTDAMRWYERLKSAGAA